MQGLIPRLRDGLGELPPVAVDIALALGLASIEAFNLYRQLVVDDCPCSVSGALAAAMVLATTVPLLWRRRFPAEVAYFVGTATFLASTQLVPLLNFGLLVALFTVANLGRDPKRRIAFVIMVVALIVNPLIEGDFEAIPEDTITFGTAWALGTLARTRRAYIGELENRARQLEAERDTQAKLAVADERARIARELHDMIGHSLTVMVVQTQAARSVLSADAHQADSVLEDVENTGRTSLEEIRRLVGLLRVKDDPARSPQPSLQRLDSLLEGFRKLGLQVVVRKEGQPRPLPSSVDLAAYRIVQESLTNSLKHAGASKAEVSIDYRDAELQIEVSDDGCGGTPEKNGGNGIRGMRERATLLQGTLDARSGTSGGFVVRATLPMEAPR